MSTRDRSVLSVLILVIVAVGGYFLIVKPKQHQATQVETQITQARSQLSQLEAQVQAGVLAESRVHSYARELRSLAVAVPVDEQVPQLINDLQATAHRDRVGFQVISTSGSAGAPAPATTSGAPAATSAASFPSQAFSFTFTGDYFAVADFLGSVARYVRAIDQRIHATRRLITIASVNLSPGLAMPTDVPAGTGPVTATMTATDYYIPAAAIGQTPATGVRP